MTGAAGVPEVHSSGLDVPFKYFIWLTVEQNRWQALQLIKKFLMSYGTLKFPESPSLVLILRHMGPIHTHSFHFLRSVLILTSHLCLGLPQQSVSFTVFHQNSIWTHFQGCPLPAHLIIRDFISLIILFMQFLPSFYYCRPLRSKYL